MSVAWAQRQFSLRDTEEERRSFSRNYPTPSTTPHLMIGNSPLRITRSRRKLTHSPSKIRISTQRLIRKKNHRVECFSISAFAETLLSMSLFAEQVGEPRSGRDARDPRSAWRSSRIGAAQRSSTVSRQWTMCRGCVSRPLECGSLRMRGELRPRRRFS